MGGCVASEKIDLISTLESLELSPQGRDTVIDAVEGLGCLLDEDADGLLFAADGG